MTAYCRRSISTLEKSCLPAAFLCQTTPTRFWVLAVQNSLTACLWSIAVGNEFRRVPPARHCCAATIPVLLTIRVVGKWLFGDQSKESLIEVPEGQLYLVR